MILLKRLYKNYFCHRYSCFSLTKADERTISINGTSFLDIIFNHDDFKQVRD